MSTTNSFARIRYDRQALSSLFRKVPASAEIGETPLLRLDLFQNEIPDFKIFAKAEWRNPGGPLKEDIRPEILDESVIDEKVRVTIDDAYDYCGLLAKQGVFVGQSSGAYLKAAHEIGKRDKRGLCATLLCDIGERYFSTRLWD